MNSETATVVECPPKKVLVSFLTFDKDNFDLKKEDLVFRKRHGWYLSGEEYKNIPVNQIKHNELWLPAVAMTRYGELKDEKRLHFDEYHLIYNGKHEAECPLLESIKSDILAKCPNIIIHTHKQTFKDPYNFKDVYTFLYELSGDDAFHKPNHEYYINCTSGTYVMRSCLFVLTQEGLFPGVRIEPRPWIDEDHREHFSPIGSYQIDDPKAISDTRNDLETKRKRSSKQKLLAPTVNKDFKLLQERITRTVSARPNQKQMIDPILFTGATGSGKTTIVENIKTLWGIRDEKFIRVNCAELCGDANIAKSTLFGHVAGSFTDAKESHEGKFKEADGGLLFLDEIGELDPEVQAMLLTAIERRPGRTGYVFTPLGGTKKDEVESKFNLICGTNRDLFTDPTFRKDLLARISTWHFELPSLAERRDDIPEQKKYALIQFKEDYKVSREFSPEARERFEAFAAEWPWELNFREFNDMIRRMATLTTEGASISLKTVESEIAYMKRNAVMRGQKGQCGPKVEAKPEPDIATVAPASASCHVSGMDQLKTIVGNELAKIDMKKRILAAYLIEAVENAPEIHTQKELAEKAGISESDASRWLSACGLQFRDGHIIRRTTDESA